MLLCRRSGGEVNSQQMRFGGLCCVERGGGQEGGLEGAGLLYLTGGRGGCLAAHAGGVDGFGWDQIQVLVVWDLIETVAVLQ